MPVIQVAAAVKFVRAAFGNHTDLGSRRTSILSLIIRGENLELFDCIDTDGGKLIAVIAGVDIADAIQRQVVLIVSRTVCADSGQTRMSRNLVVVIVNNTRRKASQR